MTLLIQHCSRELNVVAPAPIIVDDLFNPPRLTYSDLDAQYTLRMHNVMSRNEYLDAMLGNWDGP